MLKVIPPVSEKIVTDVRQIFHKKTVGYNYLCGLLRGNTEIFVEAKSMTGIGKNQTERSEIMEIFQIWYGSMVFAVQEEGSKQGKEYTLPEVKEWEKQEWYDAICGNLRRMSLRGFSKSIGQKSHLNAQTYDDGLEKFIHEEAAWLEYLHKGIAYWRIEAAAKLLRNLIDSRLMSDYATALSRGEIPFTSLYLNAERHYRIAGDLRRIDAIARGEPPKSLYPEIGKG